jgi:LacI family transcriptional regulator
VADLVRATPLTRRVLERRFRKVVGHTVHREIVRVRMQRVRQLLLETDLPMTVIARRTGFRHVEYLSAAFKRETGISPSQFRQGG